MEKVVVRETSEDHCLQKDDISGREKLCFSFNQQFAKVESFLSSYAFVLLFLFVYAASVALMFLWGAQEQFVTTPDRKKRWPISIARGFGYTLNLNCALVIILASRLIFTKIRDTPLNLVIPFDKTFPSFHMVVGYTIFIAVLGHGAFHMSWIIGWNEWKGGLWGINMCVGTGFAIAVVLTMMVITSRSGMRSKRFSLFYKIHNLGAFLFFILLIFHGVYHGVPYTYKWIVGPLVVYMIDRLARRWKITNSHVLLTAKHSALKGANVVKVRVPKQFDYRAGQYAELKVPSIHSFEWHPFTIASAPFEESMCFYVKAVGDWTMALRRAFEDRLLGVTNRSLEVLIRGPYGAPAQHVAGYQRVVLISGGVGATPFASICKELYHNLSFGQNENDQERDVKTLDSPIIRKAQSQLMGCIEKMYDLEIEASMQDKEPVPHLHLAETLFEDDQEDPTEMSGSTKLPPLDRVGLSFRQLEQNINAEPDTRADDLSKHSTLDAFLKDPKRTKLLKKKVPKKRRSKLMIVLHSIFMNLFACVIMILRVFIIACASIFESDMLKSSNGKSTPVLSTSLATIDVILGGTTILLLLVTLATELLNYKGRYFKSFGRIIDLVLLFPVSILSILYTLSFVIGKTERTLVPAHLHFIVILPSLFILLVIRLYRVIGSRILLADSSGGSTFEKMKAIDFIWTVPYEHDDDWLREELEPLANDAHLRLHRFVTRQEKHFAKEEGITSSGLNTNFGRPQWEDLFGKIAERTPSGGKVGVFFCGPKGMAKAVKENIMKVQVLTNMRATYFGSSSDEYLSDELQIQKREELNCMRSRGNNIRFVFREENFG